MNGKKKTVFIIMPVLLIASTGCVFYFGARAWGQDTGYLAGFVFYWLFWCLCVPLLFHGRRFFTMLRDKKPLFQKKNWWIIALLASTVIMPVWMYLIPKWAGTPPAVILMAVPLALAHGFFEEVFWRGLYISVFPDDPVMGFIYPALLFYVWHIAPQLALPSAAPVVFVLSTLPLGVTYGLTAYVTKSAKWSAVAHGVSGVLAFSGYLAASLYNVLQ